MKIKLFSPISRRQALARVAQAIALSSVAGIACAQQDSSPVRFVIASTPGTGPDTMSRIIQPMLQTRWQRSVVVENKPGAGGVIGIDTLAKSAADGTSLMLQTSTMFLLPYFYKQLPFDPVKSFQPITQVGWSTFALVVNGNVPAKTLPELIDWIKKSPTQISYASPGKGTENHLFGELFKQQTGVDLLHVPYRGTAPAITDVMAGQVAMMFLPIATAMKQAQSDRLHVIGATSKERFPLMPDVPSLYEQGLTGFDFSVWYGIWAPAGLSPELTRKYNTDLREVLSNPEVVRRFEEQGWAVKVGTAEELDALGKRQFAVWRDVVAKSKVDTNE